MGEIRFEVYAGVEVGYKARRHPDNAVIRYQISVYKSGLRFRELTDDEEEALELLKTALNNPKQFREDRISLADR